jgi:hypothetical protein
MRTEGAPVPSPCCNPKAHLLGACSLGARHAHSADLHGTGAVVAAAAAALRQEQLGTARAAVIKAGGCGRSCALGSGCAWLHVLEASGRVGCGICLGIAAALWGAARH